MACRPRRHYMVDTSLIKKLGIKPKHRVNILNAPEGYSEQIGTLLSADVELFTTPTSAGKFDLVLQFVRNMVEIVIYTPEAILQVKPVVLFWISYPKQSSKVPTDINRDILWKIFPNSEWRPVTQISIDEIWSALRFRPKTEVGT